MLLFAGGSTRRRQVPEEHSQRRGAGTWASSVPGTWASSVPAARTEANTPGNKHGRQPHPQPWPGLRRGLGPEGAGRKPRVPCPRERGAFGALDAHARAWRWLRAVHTDLFATMVTSEGGPPWAGRRTCCSWVPSGGLVVPIRTMFSSRCEASGETAGRSCSSGASRGSGAPGRAPGRRQSPRKELEGLPHTRHATAKAEIGHDAKHRNKGTSEEPAHAGRISHAWTHPARPPGGRRTPRREQASSLKRSTSSSLCTGTFRPFRGRSRSRRGVRCGC